jgi:hypothetical protein
MTINDKGSEDAGAAPATSTIDIQSFNHITQDVMSRQIDLVAQRVSMMGVN